MREINERLEGQLVIDSEDVTVTGVVVGHVVVEEERHLVISGTVIGALEVRRDARLDVEGIVVGSIISLGGDVVIGGVVEGTLSGDTITISPEAVIHDYIN
jgi:cytoskeletal protein CcmA (bactofilin family)